MKKLLTIIIVVTLTGCFGSEPKTTGKEGKPMPDFSMLLIDSTTWIHSKDIPSNKPVALIYFSPYCPYCKAQIENITENMNNLKNIQFYLISAYPLPSVKKFSQEHKLLQFSNIITGIDTTNKLSDYFEIAGVPYIAIYGRNKTLIKSFEGKIYSSQIKKVSEE